jgi:hypothetical protein
MKQSIPKIYTEEQKNNDLIAWVVLHPHAEKIYSSVNELLFYLKGLIHNSYVERGLNYISFRDMSQLFSTVYDNIYEFNQYRHITDQDKFFKKYLENIDQIKLAFEMIYTSMFLHKVKSLEGHLEDYEKYGKVDNITFDEWSNNWRSGIIVYEFEEREMFMNVDKMQLVLLEFLKIFDKKHYY